MALKNQVRVWSVDTGHFYTRKEKYLHWKKNLIDFEISELSVLIKNLNKQIEEQNKKEIEEKINKYKEIKKIKNKKKKEIKEKMLQMFHSRLSNSKTPRVLRDKDLTVKNVISVFESNTTRLLSMKSNEIDESLIIVQTFYFDVLQDIIINGFTFKGHRYKFFTASAGQIRTKKSVFIREELWNKNEKTFLCGLTIDDINRLGGMNVNKFLAYLGLNNSATDEWSDFDIDKTIVIPDFESNVKGVVDYIDYKTFEIERKEMKVPITHTDGAGMMLPTVSNKNFMIRLPWVKGLLCVFDFRKFVNVYNGSPIIKDIYGVEHDIIKEDIQIIFTESQFKAHSLYSSWSQYKTYFKLHNCKANICNVEEDHISNSEINYQMLQTLTDITIPELQQLVCKSNEKLVNLVSTVQGMKRAFGVREFGKNKTYLQDAISLYPEILNDPYCKQVISAIKKSLLKSYRSGKLELESKYTFIIPDWFAVCENLFLGVEKPRGLLQDGQVSCSLYSKYKKLDCLRSPHLYREHAVRNNINNTMTSEWFTTKALYVSVHDLISKILQFDVDGDKSLVVAEPLMVKIAERNMKDIVPLYYEMKKAKAIQINNENIYQGMIAAYTGGNIGIYSNNISKIWNSEIFKTGTQEEKQEALDTIKHLCLQNNFTIDYAKTLFKPDVPKHIQDTIKKYTNCKLPYFFVYAKDKEINQVEKTNSSTVNQIQRVVINKRIQMNLKKFGSLDIKYLMNNPSIDIDYNVIKLYSNLNRQYHFLINMEDKYSHKNNLHEIAKIISNNLSQFGYSNSDVCDMLVKYLYEIRQSKNKESLWFVYGDIIVDNLKNNLYGLDTICMKCGCRFSANIHNQIYCKECSSNTKTKPKIRKCVVCGNIFEIKRVNDSNIKCGNCLDKKISYCMDCGKPIAIPLNAKKKTRCPECKSDYKRLYDRERYKKRK